MRLWYQSMTRPATWPAYNTCLRTVLDRAKAPGTTIEIHGIEKRGGGIGDAYRYLEFIETHELLENVERATREKFDGFLIGNIGDPGLREAREITDMPVLGLCETSVHLANMMAGNFSLVTGNQKQAAKIVENITKYGLREKLFAVRRMNVERLVDLNEAFVNPQTCKALTAALMDAAAAHVADGAEVVIPAVGVMMVLLARDGIHEVAPGMPILNGVMALVKMGEAAVNLRSLFGGSWTSRRSMYAAPPPEQIAELRLHYGPVYPWLEGADS